MKWDRPAVATKILDALGTMRRAYPAGAGETPAVHRAIQLALELARTDFTEVPQLVERARHPASGHRRICPPGGSWG